LQLFDFRKMQSIHRREFTNVQTCVNWSADGERLLSCGRDDVIRCFDDALCTFEQSVIPFRHKNNTGIWISDFKPVFHPKYSEIVVTGNLDKKGIDFIHFGKANVGERQSKAKSFNVNALDRIKSVHSFGAVHERFDDYLFGVTYGKIVFYVNLSSGEEQMNE